MHFLWRNFIKLFCRQFFNMNNHFWFCVSGTLIYWNIKIDFIRFYFYEKIIHSNQSYKIGLFESSEIFELNWWGSTWWKLSGKLDSVACIFIKMSYSNKFYQILLIESFNIFKSTLLFETSQFFNVEKTFFKFCQSWSLGYYQIFKHALRPVALKFSHIDFIRHCYVRASQYIN